MPGNQWADGRAHVIHLRVRCLLLQMAAVRGFLALLLVSMVTVEPGLVESSDPTAVSWNKKVGIVLQLIT